MSRLTKAQLIVYTIEVKKGLNVSYKPEFILNGFYLPPSLLILCSEGFVKHFRCAICSITQILPSESDKILPYEPFSRKFHTR